MLRVYVVVMSLLALRVSCVLIVAYHSGTGKLNLKVASYQDYYISYIDGEITDSLSWLKEREEYSTKPWYCKEETMNTGCIWFHKGCGDKWPDNTIVVDAKRSATCPTTVTMAIEWKEKPGSGRIVVIPKVEERPACKSFVVWNDNYVPIGESSVKTPRRQIIDGQLTSHTKPAPGCTMNTEGTGMDKTKGECESYQNGQICINGQNVYGDEYKRIPPIGISYARGLVNWHIRKNYVLDIFGFKFDYMTQNYQWLDKEKSIRCIATLLNFSLMGPGLWICEIHGSKHNQWTGSTLLGTMKRIPTITAKYTMAAGTDCSFSTKGCKTCKCLADGKTMKICMDDDGELDAFTCKAAVPVMTSTLDNWKRFNGILTYDCTGQPYVSIWREGILIFSDNKNGEFSGIKVTDLASSMRIENLYGNWEVSLRCDKKTYTGYKGFQPGCLNGITYPDCHEKDFNSTIKKQTCTCFDTRKTIEVFCDSKASKTTGTCKKDEFEPSDNPAEGFDSKVHYPDAKSTTNVIDNVLEKNMLPDGLYEYFVDTDAGQKRHGIFAVKNGTKTSAARAGAVTKGEGLVGDEDEEMLRLPEPTVERSGSISGRNICVIRWFSIIVARILFMLSFY